MAVNKVIKTVFQFRRATTAEWELNKHIKPAPGEPCFDLDLNILKIGNGIDTYENLVPINGAKFEIAADGKSIVLEEGTLKLFGFDTAKVGAQPRKNADGNIEWVVPSTEVIDGLKDTVDSMQTNVTNLQTNITNLQTNVTEIQQIVMPNDEGVGTLLDRVESLETKMGTDEGTIDARIDTKINEFANQISDDGTVNTLKELIGYVATHGGEVESIVNDIIVLKGLIGDTKVSDQINDATSGKVNAVDGKSLVSDTLIAKLEVVEEGSQANKIEAINLGDIPLEIVNKTVSIPVGAGLKFSNELTVAEDGTVGIGTISFSKIAQDETEIIVMDGGSAV